MRYLTLYLPYGVKNYLQQRGITETILRTWIQEEQEAIIGKTQAIVRLPVGFFVCKPTKYKYWEVKAYWHKTKLREKNGGSYSLVLIKKIFGAMDYRMIEFQVKESTLSYKPEENPYNLKRTALKGIFLVLGIFVMIMTVYHLFL